MLSPSDWVDLVESKAPGLRRAGVLRIVLDGCTVELAPYVPEFEPEQLSLVHIGSEDPLDDPWTYGEGAEDIPRRREVDR